MNARFQRPKPTPGNPIRRGKPFFAVTWLAKLLGGSCQCHWSAWFRGHYQHDKRPDDNADQLDEWNREHNELMLAHRALLEENGWTVQSEHEVKLDGNRAVLAGREDLVATMPGHILIVDGKTGKQRESDRWQVLLYLWVRVLAARKQPSFDPPKMHAEVIYKGGASKTVTVDDVAANESTIVSLVNLLSGPTAPPRIPSRYECERCNVRREDCPERHDAQRAIAETVSTEAF